MKKNFFKVLVVALLVVACSIGLLACKKTPSVTKYDSSAAKVYSMDLSGIEGYSDKSVTNGTWAETYDKLISWIKVEKDTETRYALMHAAEDLLMSTGDIVPIYYYTDIYMISDSVSGFFASPLGYKYFMYTSIEGGAKSLPVCIASEPAALDPALNSSVDGATVIIHNFSGLVKYNADKELEADCAVELPEPTIAANGEATYVFQLKDSLKWSNGDDLKASDFEYSWKRAASTKLGADYGYMFEVVKGYGEADDANGLAPLAVVADDDANTLTVTTNVEVPYFYELCAFPAYMPVNKAIVTANGDKWATAPETYIGNGPYTMTGWDHNSVITLTKNANYHDADAITMDEVKFYLSDDASNMLANFKKGDWLMIDDVPTNEIKTLEKDYPTEYKVDSQLGTYYICFNNNVDFLPATDENKALTVDQRQLANTEIRKALSLLIDRTYICEEIGQAGQQPASSFVALGLTDADGKTQFYMNAGNPTQNGYVGYFNASSAAQTANAAAAVETLKKYFTYEDGKFTNFPTFTYLYNTNEGHKAIAEAVQAQFSAYGIKMTLQNQEWNTFLETRKTGDYGVARNGWLGDYNDPISFLDMWTTQSGNNDVQFGK